MGRSSSRCTIRRVKGHSVEVKLSTEWESGVFMFQSFRAQEYMHVILLGYDGCDDDELAVSAAGFPAIAI
jgi:hypothetical protein